MTKKKIKLNKLFLSALISVSFALPAFSADDVNTSKAFNLITVVDNFLNLDGDSKSAYETMDEKTRQRQDFIEATRRFNQGNVSVAYNDYSKIISETDNDISLLVFAKSMYEIGFFTLGDLSVSKIKNQNFFEKQIKNLSRSYKDKHPLDKQEEIFLAKAYSSIYFDNTPEETAFDLSKKTGLLEKSDYANFVMSQALTESRQYQQALMFIEEAIKRNPENSAYLCYKVNILNLSGKQKEAYKFLEKLEASNEITPEFENRILVLKEEIDLSLSNNENDKKFHSISINYLNGNYYKVINECQNILNFNKNNHKILTLQAKSQFIVGKTELAKKNFLQSYSLNKSYGPTLSGLGDIAYIEKDYKKALEYYKKALKSDKEDKTILVKISLCYKNIEGNEKNLARVEKQLKDTNSTLFYENYIVAATILKNDPKLRREYLLKSLGANLLFENAQNEFLAYLNDTGKMKAMEGFLHTISFVSNYDYNYYYFRGIVERALGKRELALSNIKHSLSLNPDFEPASKALIDFSESGV